MSATAVAIVGRPNVGKSSLLNQLAGRRVSIVEPTAGVTRDRVTVSVEIGGRRFQATDTGGLGLVDEERLKDHIERQIAHALDASDVVVFVVDGKEGFVPGDQLVADRLRRLGKPVVLAVNKIESFHEELGVHEWARLGFGDPWPISALEGVGITDLCDRILELAPPAAEPDADVLGEDVLKFAVVGKRNSGKSTLINRLAGEERVIVSEIPGTTRDSVDVLFERDGRRMLAIDTAGVRKKSSVQDAIELFSYARATESIRRADVVLHLFDVHETISQVDRRVAQYCAAHYKPVVLVGNKIDDVVRVDLDRWDAYIRQQLSGVRYAPVSFLSALSGQHVDATLDLLYELRDQARTEIPTARLNEVLHEAKKKLSPKERGGKVPKLYYGTQIGSDPATLLIFVNEPKLFHGQYERYLQNVLRDEFGLEEVPIRLIFRERVRDDAAPAGPIERGE